MIEASFDTSALIKGQPQQNPRNSCRRVHTRSRWGYQTPIARRHMLPCERESVCVCVRCFRSWIQMCRWAKVNQNCNFTSDLCTQTHSLFVLFPRNVIPCWVLNGSLDAKLTLLFEHKCVLAVCVYNHPIMIKIHLVVFFLISINNIPFFKSSHSQLLGCVMSHRPRPLPRLLIDTAVFP